jgi:hypothetical protein
VIWSLYIAVQPLELKILYWFPHMWASFECERVGGWSLSLSGLERVPVFICQW